LIGIIADDSNALSKWVIVDLSALSNPDNSLGNAISELEITFGAAFEQKEWSRLSLMLLELPLVLTMTIFALVICIFFDTIGNLYWKQAVRTGIFTTEDERNACRKWIREVKSKVDKALFLRMQLQLS